MSWGLQQVLPEARSSQALYLLPWLSEHQAALGQGSLTTPAASVSLPVQEPGSLNIPEDRDQSECTREAADQWRALVRD